MECQKICERKCQIECQNICERKCQVEWQMECQKICERKCQIHCQKICERKCQVECQMECQKICERTCQIECQKKIGEKMSDRIAENVSERMSDIECQIECQNICQIRCQTKFQIKGRPECQNIYQTDRIECQLVGITRRTLFYHCNFGYTQFLGTQKRFVTQSPFSLSQKLYDSTGCGGTSCKEIMLPPGTKIKERIEGKIMQHLHKAIGFNHHHSGFLYLPIIHGV